MFPHFPSPSFFFLNDTAPPDISPLPLPAALPIPRTAALRLLAALNRRSLRRRRLFNFNLGRRLILAQPIEGGLPDQAGAATRPGLVHFTFASDRKAHV